MEETTTEDVSSWKNKSIKDVDPEAKGKMEGGTYGQEKKPDRETSPFRRIKPPAPQRRQIFMPTKHESEQIKQIVKEVIQSQKHQMQTLKENKREENSINNMLNKHKSQLTNLMPQKARTGPHTHFHSL